MCLYYLAMTVKGRSRVQRPLTMIEMSAHLRAAVSSTHVEIPLTRDGERGTVTLRKVSWMHLSLDAFEAERVAKFQATPVVLQAH